MWNTNNASLVNKYGQSSLLPSDQEYGEYLMREFLTLGYAARKLAMSGGSVFGFIVRLFDGCDTVVFCKSAASDIDDRQMQSFVALRSMYKNAIRYCVVTNTHFGQSAKKIADLNHVVCVSEFRIGDEAVMLLADIGLLPRGMANQFVKMNEQCKTQEYQTAVAEAIRKKDEELKEQRKKAEAEQRRMTVFEKYDRGMLDDNIQEAIRVAGTMDSISSGGLARKMHIDVEEAKHLISLLGQLGVISKAEPCRPREVIMTAGMIEKRFGVVVPTSFK